MDGVFCVVDKCPTNIVIYLHYHLCSGFKSPLVLHFGLVNYKHVQLFSLSACPGCLREAGRCSTHHQSSLRQQHDYMWLDNKTLNVHQRHLNITARTVRSSTELTETHEYPERMSDIKTESNKSFSVITVHINGTVILSSSTWDDTKTTQVH